MSPCWKNCRLLRHRGVNIHGLRLVNLWLKRLCVSYRIVWINPVRQHNLVLYDQICEWNGSAARNQRWVRHVQLNSRRVAHLFTACPTSIGGKEHFLLLLHCKAVKVVVLSVEYLTCGVRFKNLMPLCSQSVDRRRSRALQIEVVHSVRRFPDERNWRPYLSLI